MTNGEKILVGIVVIATIITGIILATNNNKTKENINNQKSEIDNMSDYINENKKNNNVENDTDNTIDKNEVSNENIIENEGNNNIEANNEINNTIVGKEEQESNNQNTEFNNEKKAIELAQKEWGLSINAYNFEAKLQDDGNYKVTVRGKTGNLEEIVTYMVDVKKGIVEDITE